MKTRSIACGLALLASSLLPLAAQTQENVPLKNGGSTGKVNVTAFPPFEIVNNVYYVGSQDQSSFLIKTNQGLILVNSGYEESVPAIEQSIQKLGFKMSDIKVLLISHAHIDHDAGSAQIIKDSGAKYEVMEPDVSVVESGGHTDFQNGKIPTEWYPPVKVDRVLHDNDKIDLGGTSITAHLTGGHTKGCATYTFDEKQDNRDLHVLILCGMAASAGPNRTYKLLNNPDYPNVKEDFEHTFAVLPALPCDVFLGAHGRYFNLKAKYDKLQAGDKNAFIDPQGYQAYVARGKEAFERDLKKQEDAAKQPTQ